MEFENKSQLEIETMLSNDAIYETIKVESEIFYNNMDEKDLDGIKKIVDTDDVEELMLYIISLLGNPEMGKKVKDGREMPLDSIVKAIAGIRWMELKYSFDIEERIRKSIQISDALDGILYDIKLERIDIKDNQKIVLPVAVIEFSLKSNLEKISLSREKFPLIEKPKNWNVGESGGYYTGISKVTLNRGEGLQPQECLDVLNKLQSQEYSLINESKQELQDYIYTKQLQTFQDDKASEITKHTTMSTQEVFNTMKNRKFYFQWKYDFRGRMYSTGYDINLQGDKYRKGIVNPTMQNFEGYEITEDTTKWIKVDIANQLGLDKLSFQERFNQINEKIDILESLQEQAESPKEYQKAVEGLRIAEKGLVPNSMVYLDASNQALQLYAVLTGDLKTAATCNLANGNKMADAYQLLANAMNKHMNLQCFTRKNCKKSLMTTMYGKMDGWTEILEAMYPRMNYQIQLFARDYNLEIVINKDTGIGTIPALTNAFKEAMLDIAPKAVATMEAIQSLNKEGIGTYKWTLPDGFNVKYDVKVEENKIIEATLKKGWKLTVCVNKQYYKASKFNRGMSPNIIHSVDGWVAREMIRRMNGKFITTIHDAFACHPNDVRLMRKNYADIMVELLHSDMLNDIMSQIAGKQIILSKDNGLTEEHIRSSVYMLS